eukprot:m.84009 g.84009  ORF g.84009 m.84009 type:complete len:723 (+) comp12950_c0_seq2:176-2344(+)
MQRLGVVVVLIAIFLPFTPGHDSNQAVCDVLVVGATPAGIAASITASKQGKNVILVEPSSNIGGMMTGGIGWDDVDLSQDFRTGPAATGAVPPAVYGEGQYTTYANRVYQYYSAISPMAAELSVNGTRHEPHIAPKILSEMLMENHVTVMTNLSLSDVMLSGETIKSTKFVNLQTKATFEVTSKVTVDATYEGDVIAASNVSYSIGREARKDYGEINAGVVFQDFTMHNFLRGSTGSSDPHIPAMTYRLCFENASRHETPLPQPDNYNRSVYLGYIEDVAQGRMNSSWHAWSTPRPLPPNGQKFDINCNPRPLGFIWLGPEKENYVSADIGAREIIRASLRDLTLGLLYFLQNDEAVPLEERIKNREFGLCQDEWNVTTYPHFPAQLYIREARRLSGLTILTEHDMIPVDPSGRPPLSPYSTCVGSYAIDSFPCTPQKPSNVQQSCNTALEGYVGMESNMNAPFTMPAQIMIPKKCYGIERTQIERACTRNVTNLVVAAAVSATHVAFSAVRLEPTWILLGTAAGLVASLSLEFNQVDASKVNITYLQKKIVEEAKMPLVFCTDLLPTHENYSALQRMLPWTAATDTFACLPENHITLETAGYMLFQALHSKNIETMDMDKSTHMERVRQAIQQHPKPHRWRDFGPGDAHFLECAALRSLDIIPLLDDRGLFRPTSLIPMVTFVNWISRSVKSGKLKPLYAEFVTRAHASALLTSYILDSSL